MAATDSKPVIVLIHGGASSQRMYKTTVPLLQSKGFTCLTPDLPGHGTTAKEGIFTFEAAQTVLCEYLNAHITPATSSTSSETSTSASVVLVGISLGGQVVLSFLQNVDARLNSSIQIAGAIVSGAFIHPADEKAGFEMPHLPTDQEWLDIIMEDVQIAGMENMADLQARSFAFNFDAEMTRKNLENSGRVVPPIQIMIGEHDVAMAKRDFEELTILTKTLNGKSEGIVLEGAWHNHSIDVPEQFATAVVKWVAGL